MVGPRRIYSSIRNVARNSCWQKLWLDSDFDKFVKLKAVFSVLQYFFTIIRVFFDDFLIKMSKQ